MTPEEVWRGRRDAELLDAASRLQDYYEEGQWEILTEMARRGLRLPNGELPTVPARPVSAPVVSVPTATPETARHTAERVAASRPPLWPPAPVIAHLWRGDFPLGITYWGFAQLGGLVLAVPQLGLRLKGFIAAAEVLDGVALVYSFIVIVAIWRSAARYPGHRVWADLARAATILPMVLAAILALVQR